MLKRVYYARVVIAWLLVRANGHDGSVCALQSGFAMTRCEKA